MNNDSIPNRIVMSIPGMSIQAASVVAREAARKARSYAPKLTIASSSRFVPIFGEGWFGVAWLHDYVWFQENGTRPFTMRSLAGKTIPMWINDPTGEERRKNPNARTRTVAGGRVQVLIFRRAAKIGQRKNVWRKIGGRDTLVSVPASYPGAPGRIAVNRSRGLIRQGDVAPGVGNPGWIAKGNVGVRWRHPGLQSGKFLARAVAETARENGFPTGTVTYESKRRRSYDRSFSPYLFRE